MLAAGILLAVAASAVPPEFVDVRLDNGLEVTIVPDRSMPVVATQVWYHVGSANEDPGSRGLAHLFEHLMFGATATRSKEDYSKFITAAGGDDNAYTSPDETVYVAEVPPLAAEGVLRREADRMRNLAITQENLDNEKKIVTEELRLRTENDPVARLLVKAQKALLGAHPYGFDATGSKEDVAKATVEGCRAFYDRYYRPNEAQVVVVGPVDADATLSLVKETFGAIPAGGKAEEDVPSLYGWKFPDKISLKEDIPPVEVALEGVPLPDADASDGWAVSVMLQVLTGRSVDPFREIVVRRRKMAIEAGTQSIELRRGGGLVFYSASLPYRREKTAFRVIDETLAELDRLDWLTDESVASAKRAMLLSETRSRIFAAGLAGQLGSERWWDGDTRLAFTRMERIDAVTRDDVEAAWRKYVHDGTKIRVYVRPEHIPFYIRMFGWLYPLFS
jgi:zinc protease